MSRGKPDKPRINAERKRRSDVAPGRADTGAVRALLLQHPEGLNRRTISQMLKLSFEGYERLSTKLSTMMDLESFRFKTEKEKRYRIRAEFLPKPVAPPPAPVALPAPVEAPVAPPTAPDEAAAAPLPTVAHALGVVIDYIRAASNDALSLELAKLRGEVGELRRDIANLRTVFITGMNTMADVAQAGKHIQAVGGTVKVEPPPPEAKVHVRRLPKILILGLDKGNPDLIRQEFSSTFDLEFMDADVGAGAAGKLKSLSAHSAAVFAMKDFVPHSVTLISKPIAGERFHLIDGGMTSLRKALNDWSEVTE